jgi:peptidyl-prolyl cis-trans isomerase SurA
MKYKFPISALLLAIVASFNATAQVASHAPTAIFNQAPVSSGPMSSGRPVARVNGVVLTDRDLLREEYVIFPYARQHNGNIPREMEPGIRNGALQMIIFEELVYQEARKRGLTVTTERLSQAEAEFRKQFDSPSEYQHYLNAECQGKEQLLHDRIKRSLLIDRLLKAEVERKSTVTAAELKAYYDKNPALFQYADSFAIQTISVIPPANATPAQVKEARKRAEEALKQAKATKTAEEFGLLAEKISDDDYRVMMGDHKWVERSKMPPQMLEPALKMQADQVSDLIQVDQNYVVFRMNRHVPAGKMKFDDVKDNLRKELEKRKTNEVRAALDKKLRQNAKVETL